MSERSQSLQNGLIAVSAVGWAVAIPVAPVFGVPMMALSLALLAYRKGKTAAWAVAALAAVLVILVDRVSALLVVPSAMAATAAASALKKNSAIKVAVLLSAVVFAGYASMTVGMFLVRGHSITEVATSAPRLVYEEAAAEVEALPLSAADEKALLGELREARKTLSEGFGLLPMMFVLMAAVTGVLTVVAVSWAGRRTDVGVGRLPPLSSVDLSPWLVLVLVLAVAFLAAASFTGRTGGWMAQIGWNLFGVARWTFFVQGLAVLSALHEKAGYGPGRRAFGYIVAFLAEVFVFATSLMGLVDMWVNFRRLPRDGREPVAAGP